MIFYSKFKGKETFDRIVVVLFLLYCIVNVFRHLIVQLVGGIGNIVVIYLFTLYFIFLYGKPIAERKARIHYVSLCLFLFIYILGMQFLYKNAQFYDTFGVAIETHVWNLISFVPMTLCAIFIVKKTTVTMAIWLKRIFICILLITLIPSIVMLMGDASLAKQSATSSGEYIPFLVNYSTVYALSIISPYFLFSYSSEYKFFGYVMSAVVVICICLSSFFIAIMATFLGLLVCLILRVKNKTLCHFLIFLSVTLLILFIYSDAAYNMLLRISSNLPQGLIRTRVSQLALFLKTGETGDTTARIDLYKGALDLVARHPVFGNIAINENFKLSGHSEFLDVWGGCGILSIICLLSFLSSVYYMNKSFYKSENSKSVLKASTLVFLFVSLSNPIFSSSTISVFWILAPLIWETEKGCS